MNYIYKLITNIVCTLAVIAFFSSVLVYHLFWCKFCGCEVYYHSNHRHSGMPCTQHSI